MVITRSRDFLLDVGARPFKAFMSSYWYPSLTRRLEAENLTCLNYGYEEDPPMRLPLAESDEKNRYGIQLYHSVASQSDLRGKRVLEVSCGHGGGAAYLARTMEPASYTGLDYNPDGVAFCQRTHHVPGLDFVHGDAENLPFDDNSFDVVVNVEASHAYPHLARFLTEVVRVLRPGGHLLYADFRGHTEFPGWDATLAASGLRQNAHRVINPEVLRGMDGNAQRSQEIIDRLLPAPLRPFGRRFAGVPGTGLYHVLEQGKAEYRMYDFVKDAPNT